MLFRTKALWCLTAERIDGGAGAKPYLTYSVPTTLLSISGGFTENSRWTYFIFITLYKRFVSVSLGCNRTIHFKLCVSD